MIPDALSVRTRTPTSDISTLPTYSGLVPVNICTPNSVHAACVVAGSAKALVVLVDISQNGKVNVQTGYCHVKFKVIQFGHLKI